MAESGDPRCTRVSDCRCHSYLPAGQRAGCLLGSRGMNFLAKTWIAEWILGLGRLTLLAKEAAASLFRGRIAWRDLLYQIYFMGVKSQSVVLITGAFTGMVLGAQ